MLETDQNVPSMFSDAYTIEILQMFWLPEGPVSYKKDMDLNQFTLTNVTTKECIDMFPDGKYFD